MMDEALQELMARLGRLEEKQKEIMERLNRIEDRLFPEPEKREVPETGPHSWAEAMKNREMQDWKKRIEKWDQLPPGRKRASWANAMYDNLIEQKWKEVQEWEEKMRQTRK
ncbi:MAG: hypothetical protein AB2401_01765 [Bacillus sp. (in: firmicutes)]